MARPSQSGETGFTVAEMLVVILIVGLLAAVAVPSINGAITRAEEAALRENLAVMRRALDDHFADKGRYPQDLETLVSERYLRFIPADPVSEDAAGWALTTDDSGGIEDVGSASDATGSNDIPYREW
ncbi:MAG: prepilin-type N-terminal cleavage/methylation domain-containing protein [Pseudomonadota bacterium]